jgi:hypothetical protein
MQRNRLVVLSCCLAALALSAGSSRAQRNGLPPGPQSRIGFLGFTGDPGNKLVTGAPYCGQVTTAFSQTLADGNQIHRTTTSNVCRDSQGRTYSQLNLPSVVSGSENSSRIVIRDPVAGVDYMLDTVNKTYLKVTHPTRKPPAGNAGNAPRFEGGGFPNGGVTSDLGFQTIAGLSCKGTRFTRTVAAHSKLGNEQPLQVVTERWYSPDLGIDIQTQTSDPSHGSTTMTVSNINRNEPDAAFFQVPAGYTPQKGGPGGFGRRPQGPISAQ